METSDEFDVIVVGGRVAGASLAIRLGERGLSVLVVDKANFPCLPEVPSCPVMYASTMAMLDELGLDESQYESVTSRISTGMIGYEGYFHAVIKMPEVQGRSYLRGVDRAGFDHTLWRHAAKQKNVTCRSGFTVKDVDRDDQGRVSGITGATKGGASERFRARLAVVGADGRHSLIARKVGARVLEEQCKYTSTIHFAEWENLAPAIPNVQEPVVQIVGSDKGYTILFFPSSQGRVNVAMQVSTHRAERGDAQEMYLRKLRALQTVNARIVGARQVGQLLGVRRIANRYLECGGPGWVLVGDALTHKDPIDSQGFCDALREARDLAGLMVSAHERRMPWQAMLSAYQDAVMGATHEMYLATMKRMRREVYSTPSPFMIRTLMRWALHDPEYQRRFMLLLSRAISPKQFRTPTLMARVIALGLVKDLRRLVAR